MKTIYGTKNLGTHRLRNSDLDDHFGNDTQWLLANNVLANDQFKTLKGSVKTSLKRGSLLIIIMVQTFDKKNEHILNMLTACFYSCQQVWNVFGQKCQIKCRT